MEKKCQNCGEKLVEITNKCCSSGAVYEYPTGEFKCVKCGTKKAEALNERRTGMKSKLKSKAGFLVCELVALGLIFSMVTIGVVKTAKNGVLKSNGQRIWCKVKGGSGSTCDAEFGIK